MCFWHLLHWIWYCFDNYFTYFVQVLLYILLYLQPEPLSRNESGRFGALKSDSTHHFFRNACTKSRSLRFSQFYGSCLYTYEFWLSLCKIVRSSLILLLSLSTRFYPQSTLTFTSFTLLTIRNFWPQPTLTFTSFTVHTNLYEFLTSIHTNLYELLTSIHTNLYKDLASIHNNLYEFLTSTHKAITSF
jgi:hypothetical protein